MPFNIEVTGTGGGTRAIPLPPEGLTIGRQQGNALVLDDRQVSRQHARIEQRGAEIIVTDLNTANGSFLNEQRITGSSPFRPGDTLRLGETTLRLQSTEAATMIGTPSPAWSPAVSSGPPANPFANTPAQAPAAPLPNAAPFPSAAPFPGTFPPPGAVAPPPAQGKSRTPLILGLVAGGGLLLCVCVVGAFFLLGAGSFFNANTTANGNGTQTVNTSSSNGQSTPAGGGTGGVGTLPGGGGGGNTGVAPGNYACTTSNGQAANRIFILDSANYADGDGGIGRYSYNAATKTITWETGIFQQFIGYYVPAGENAFGSPATTALIYNRDKAGTGTPFDGRTRDSAFSRCAP